MTSFRRARLLALALWGALGLPLRAADRVPGTNPALKLPPVIVEDARLPQAQAQLGPRWKEDLMAPGTVWKLADTDRTESFLFDADQLVRTVFGTKATAHEDGTITAGFHPMRLHWRLEAEWLVLFDRENRRIEELKFVGEGWFGRVTAARRNGEVLRFRLTKPLPAKPVQGKTR